MLAVALVIEPLRRSSPDAECFTASLSIGRKGDGFMVARQNGGDLIAPLVERVTLLALEFLAVVMPGFRVASAVTWLRTRSRISFATPQHGEPGVGCAPQIMG
jgi:hypothetical protein